MSDIKFENNLFKKLNLSIIKSQQRISYIADGGVNKGQAYQRAIKKFEEELEKGLSENTVVFTWHEILYITNELATSKHLFNTLMEYEELETFILLIRKYKKLSIYKKLFNIYFNYYSTLNKEGAMTVLKMYLKSVLRSYSGRNKYINNLVTIKEHVFGDLPQLLEHYQNNFETIKLDMKLQEDFEFSKALLNLKIIQELKALEFDEYNKDVFSTIIERKEMFFDDGFSLKEYVVKYLIDKVIDKNLPFPNWQIFILKLINDPRSTAKYSSSMGSWNLLGEERKHFFIKTLSKDDLKLFLDSLSDSVSDTNYHYRKAFWMQFLDKVVFAKIMMGNDAFDSLSDTLKEKFEFSNDSYSRLTGNHTQSAIYIDFGKIKIIEFTHNGKVRFYTDCPINLHQKTYRTSEIALSNWKKHHTMITAIAHISPETYSWQNKVLIVMNEHLNSNITKNDILIDSDLKKKAEFIRKTTNLSSNVRASISSSNLQKYSANKLCKKCNQTKDVNEFFKSKKAEYGYGNWCKDCVESYRINKEETQLCTSCSKQKPLSMFKSKTNPNGHALWCKDCVDSYKKSKNQNIESKPVDINKEETKVCTSCLQEKPLSMFQLKKHEKGHTSWCNSCLGTYRKSKGY